MSPSAVLLCLFLQDKPRQKCHDMISSSAGSAQENCEGQKKPRHRRVTVLQTKCKTGNRPVWAGSIHGRLFLVAALLSFCAGETPDISVPEEILAAAGEAVLLPCRTNVSSDILTVEWSKEGLHPNITFLYRQGCETFEMKNPVFQFRTNLIMNEMKNGNLSLRISNLQLSDAGKYQCMIRWGKNRQVLRTLELVVGAVSEPKLSAVPGEGDGLTLQCEANGSSLAPEITFHDDQGNIIPAETPKRDQDSRGNFAVRRRATVQTATSRVTCRVHQPQINQSKHTEIYITADGQRSCSTPWIIAALEALLAVGLFVLCVFLWNKYCRGKSETRKRNAEVSLPRNQTDSPESTITEQQREIERLKLTLNELTEELRDLRSQRSPAVCQHCQDTTSSPHSHPITDPGPAASANNKHPESDRLPQNTGSKPSVSRPNPAPDSPVKGRSNDNSSSTPLLGGGAVSPTSGETHLTRSMSVSQPRTRPNGAMPHRRSTISVPSYNRFSPLADLKEDSEPLISVNNN